MTGNESRNGNNPAPVGPVTWRTAEPSSGTPPRLYLPEALVGVAGKQSVGSLSAQTVTSAPLTAWFDVFVTVPVMVAAPVSAAAAGASADSARRTTRKRDARFMPRIVT